MGDINRKNRAYFGSLPSLFIRFVSLTVSRVRRSCDFKNKHHITSKRCIKCNICRGLSIHSGITRATHVSFERLFFQPKPKSINKFNDSPLKLLFIVKNGTWETKNPDFWRSCYRFNFHSNDTKEINRRTFHSHQVFSCLFCYDSLTLRRNSRSISINSSVSYITIQHKMNYEMWQPVKWKFQKKISFSRENGKWEKESEQIHIRLVFFGISVVYFYLIRIFFKKN